MSAIDWAVIGIYAAAMIGLSIHLGRGQTNQKVRVYRFSLEIIGILASKFSDH